MEKNGEVKSGFVIWRDNHDCHGTRHELKQVRSGDVGKRRRKPIIWESKRMNHLKRGDGRRVEGRYRA